MSELQKGFNPQKSLFFQRSDQRPGEQLSYLRRRSDINRSELARALGYDPGQMTHIEQGGKSMPKFIEFYESLRGILSASDQEISALLRTQESPRFLVHHDPKRMERA